MVSFIIYVPRVDRQTDTHAHMLLGSATHKPRVEEQSCLAPHTHTHTARIAHTDTHTHTHTLPGLHTHAVECAHRRRASSLFL